MQVHRENISRGPLLLLIAFMRRWCIVGVALSARFDRLKQPLHCTRGDLLNRLHHSCKIRDKCAYRLGAVKPHHLKILGDTQVTGARPVQRHRRIRIVRGEDSVNTLACGALLKITFDKFTFAGQGSAEP